MKTKILATIILPILIFAGCMDDDVINVPDESDVPGVQVNRGGPEYVDGQFIVVMKKGANPHSTINANGVKEFYVFKKALNGFVLYNANEKLVEALRKNPNVDYIEQDVKVEANVQTTPTGISRIAADATSVSGNVNVDIAIIDTGIDTDHPDLNVNSVGIHYWVQVKRNRLVPKSDSDFDDDNGHGTHCAGTAAAIDNTIGVVGVAPGARVWGVKVLDATGSGYMSDIARGVDWVTENASSIEVASMSLSGGGYSSSLRTAIQNCVAAGVVVVVAAGNDSRDVYGADGTLGTSDDLSPACFPEAMTISALCDTDGQPGGLGSSNYYGDDDSFASFSNYSGSVVSTNPVNSGGAAIDLILPGVSIYSTTPGGNYGYKSGTSMATPHAAGLVAMYIAENGRATNASGVYAIRQALIDAGEGMYTSDNGLESNASPVDPDNNHENLGWAGSGSSANGEPVAVAGNDVTASDSDGNGYETLILDGSDSYDTGGSIVSYEWKEGSTVLGTTATLNNNFNVGTHTLTLTVTDNDGYTDSDEIIVAVIANQAPEADAGNNITLTDSDDNGYENVTLNGSASDDSDGTIVSYSWSENGSVIGSGSVVSYSFDVGTHYITLTVTDDGGATATDQVTVTVEEPAPAPVVTSISPNTVDENSRVDVVIRGSNFASGSSVSFSDGDGYAPTISILTIVSSTEIRCSLRIRNSRLSNPTQWNLTVTNSDGSYNTLSNALTINPK